MNGDMNTCLQTTGMANVKTGIYKPSQWQHSQWCHAWRSQRLQKNRHRTAISVYTCVHNFAFHWVCVMVVGGRGKESHLNPHTRSHAHMYIQWQDRVVSPQTEGMQGKQALSERILFVLVFSPQSLFSSVNRLPSSPACAHTKLLRDTASGNRGAWERNDMTVYRWRYGVELCAYTQLINGACFRKWLSHEKIKHLMQHACLIGEVPISAFNCCFSTQAVCVSLWEISQLTYSEVLTVWFVSS